MSILSKIGPKRGAKKRRKLLGRGESSGLGKTSGKGHKGQKARAGKTIHPGFEGGQMPLHRRSPKWGFTQRNRRVFQVVNLAHLQEKFPSGGEVKLQSLVEIGLIRDLKTPVKILATGEIKAPLQIQAHAASESAKKAIESAKGQLEILDWKKKPSAA